jgi:hypothetical protein
MPRTRGIENLFTDCSYIFALCFSVDDGVLDLFGLNCSGAAFAFNPSNLTFDFVVGTRREKVGLKVAASVSATAADAARSPFEVFGAHGVEEPIEAFLKVLALQFAKRN